MGVAEVGEGFSPSLNESSFSGERPVKSRTQHLDESFVTCLCALAVDDLEHFDTTERCADRINVDVQVQHCDAELHDDCAVRLRDIEDSALGTSIHSREAPPLIFGEICDIFDVTLPDDHDVAAHGPVVMDHNCDTVIFEHALERVKIAAQ